MFDFVPEPLEVIARIIDPTPRVLLSVVIGTSYILLIPYTATHVSICLICYQELPLTLTVNFSIYKLATNLAV